MNARDIVNTLMEGKATQAFENLNELMEQRAVDALEFRKVAVAKGIFESTGHQPHPGRGPSATTDAIYGKGKTSFPDPDIIHASTDDHGKVTAYHTVSHKGEWTNHDSAEAARAHLKSRKMNEGRAENMDMARGDRDHPDRMSGKVVHEPDDGVHTSALNGKFRTWSNKDKKWSEHETRDAAKAHLASQK